MMTNDTVLVALYALDASFKIRKNFFLEMANIALILVSLYWQSDCLFS